MKTLVVGSGGREHALAWRLSKDLNAEDLYVAPGNPGAQSIAKVAAIDPMDFHGISTFCRDYGVKLVVVGPENPLSAGLGDHLRSQGLAVFGPGKAGARLESSKSTAKAFMNRHGIPCAKWACFEVLADALDYVARTPGPWVLKADGLAFGKGVVIANTLEEARCVTQEFMEGGLHGGAGRKLVIEEYLEGQEVTAMALTDGESLLQLPLSRDYKRAFDGDGGPMTGGMGAVSPAFSDPDAEASLAAIVKKEIFEPTLRGLASEGISYRGALYAGLMLTQDGPKALEYNVRFGDPETQCLVPRLEGNFAAAVWASATGRLAQFVAEGGLGVSSKTCVSVILCSAGYPGDYQKGFPISGLDASAGTGAFEGIDNPAGIDPIGESRGVGSTFVFHAGTRVEDGRLVTAGGRVLAVSALGDGADDARHKAYAVARSIRFEGARFRRDIAATSQQGGS